jgi:prenyltransferase beta subunit
VISRAIACEFASSGTWGSFELRDSCYSWWLLSPRWLEAAEEWWQELVIILGHLLVIMRGSCTFPGGASKATLVDCTCH